MHFKCTQKELFLFIAFVIWCRNNLQSFIKKPRCAVSFTLLNRRRRMQIIFLSSILVLAFTAIEGRTEGQGAVTNGAPCEGKSSSPSLMFIVLTRLNIVCVNVINAVKDLHATNKFKTHEEALLHHCNKVVKTGSKEDKVVWNEWIVILRGHSVISVDFVYSCSVTTWHRCKRMLAVSLVTERKLERSVRHWVKRTTMSAPLATVEYTCGEAC